MKILVDPSIWIGYFNKGLYSSLDILLENDLIVINDIILAELIPFISHIGKKEVVEALETLNKKDLMISWAEIMFFQKMNLKNGVNNIGIPDLIILQHCIQNDYTLWSNDKHFNLMKRHIEFKLFVDFE